jgi:hypothetical protein
VLAVDSQSQADAPHRVACEKAIEAIRPNRLMPNPANDWAEVAAVDAAWKATETAWLRNREAGMHLKLAQHALNAVEASQMEESGSNRAIAWLRIAMGAHRTAAAAAYEGKSEFSMRLSHAHRTDDA